MTTENTPNAKADTLMRPLAIEAREVGRSRKPMSVSLEERFLSIRDLCKALTRPEPDYCRLEVGAFAATARSLLCASPVCIIFLPFYCFCPGCYQYSWAFVRERMIIMTQVSNLGPQLPSSILEALAQPFSHLDVQLRTGPTRQKDDQWFCQVVPHVPRWIYEARLDLVVPGAWGTLSPYIVVADDRLMLAVQVRVGPITHTSCGEIRVPRLAVPDMMGEIVVSAPDAFSVAFIDACHRFGLGRYLSQFSRRWVSYDTEKQAMMLTREEQRALVHKIYQEAGLPLDLPATEMKPIGRSATTESTGAKKREREQSTVPPASIDDVRTRKRTSDLALVREKCVGQIMQNILTHYRLKRLEDIGEADLAKVIRSINQRKAS